MQDIAIEQEQSDWQDTLESMNSSSLDQDIEIQRSAYLRRHPEDSIRREYHSSYEPTFLSLTGEEDPLHIDRLLHEAAGGRALVIGASGFGLLTALMQGVKYVDIVDSNPTQIALNYMIAVFIYMTSRERLERSLEAFNEHPYDIADFASIRLPDGRASYLAHLSEVMDALQVPSDLRPMVEQNMNYTQLYFHKKMRRVRISNGDSMWDIFLRQYDEIRDRIVHRRGWEMHCEDLGDFLTSHGDTYDAIYTSNVFDYMGLSLQEFVEMVARGLRPGGFGSIHAIHGLPYRGHVNEGEIGIQVVERIPVEKGSPDQWMLIGKSDKIA